MESRAESPITQESVLDRLLVQLSSLVIESEPGARLPSEGELALRFGVSRITVREAMKVLAGRDLVDLGVGRRGIVRGPTSDTLANHLDVLIRRDPDASLQLVEVRVALEVQAAMLAARRIDDSRAERLQAAVTAMTAAAQHASTGDPSAYNRADVEFHEALAAASGNRMISLLLVSLEGALHSSFAESFRGHVKLGRSIRSGLDAHVRVCERVVAGDARGAAAAMRAMLKSSARDLHAARAER